MRKRARERKRGRESKEEVGQGEGEETTNLISDCGKNSYRPFTYTHKQKISLLKNKRETTKFLVYSGQFIIKIKKEMLTV